MTDVVLFRSRTKRKSLTSELDFSLVVIRKYSQPLFNAIAFVHYTQQFLYQRRFYFNQRISVVEDAYSHDG